MGIALAIAATALTSPRPAWAIEAFDGRLEVHGYVEEQIRAINRDFKENLDLTQWYNVLLLEVEFDILPNGLGPLGGLSAYAGFDVRYDCVWTRACGMFRSADTFGDRASKLPVRLGNARYPNMVGVLQASGDDPNDRRNPLRPFGPTLSLGTGRRVGGPDRVPGIDTLFGQPGLDRFLGTSDDPALYTFEHFLDYRFALRAVQGSENGLGIQTLGPWQPKNTIIANAGLADRVNPFNSSEIDPRTGLAPTNVATLGYRPSPLRPAGYGGDPGAARGLYVPSAATSRLIRSGDLGSFDQNFRATELQWNRGASQQDEKFLREFYLDWEALEGRLFVRTGKQTIVWGKTELFATTDQFNPRDLALASLPTLEESRIPLWSVRGVYSFYDIGPLEDVRLEVALNLDDFEPEDVGRCGEPYTPNPACNKTAGLFAHGLAGYGLVGEERPPHWWNSSKGLQGGGRIEFRWEQFSFAITDIYSYTRIPYAERVFTYERNVDPDSGRPREAGATGPCTDGTEDACLTPTEALTKHSLNQQLFAVVCSSSVAFSTLDLGVCAQSVFNSQTIVPTTADYLTHALSLVLSDVAPFASAAIYGGLAGSGAGSNANPVTLNRSATVDGTAASGLVAGSLANRLTPQQEALLGCGPLYGMSDTGCDDDGIDLLNAEASVVIQSFTAFEGSLSERVVAGITQPGTRGFLPYSGPVATRFVPGRGVVQLPGSRGPWLTDGVSLNPDYDPRIDGCVAAGFDGVAPAGFCAGASVLHPVTGDFFANELAAFSWNLQTLLIAFSSPDADGGLIPSTTRYYANAIDEFDEFNPNRTDGCSFVVPHLCSSIQSIYTVIGNRRQDVRAGGNGTYGRRDFDWAGGGEALLRYEKRNVLGFSMDFAEDYSKSNWSIETAWIDGLPFDDADQVKGISKADTWNLTFSIDRPTFINFINPNRTFFFNSQIFLQYITGYRNSFQTTGPWNALGTLSVQTGYFQDRLLPNLTFVYDVKSNSGAALPQIQYRFTESFSATVGVALFMGRFQNRKMYLEPLVNVPHVGGEDGAYQTTTEQGLAAIRERDEVFLRVRWTF